MGSLRWSNRSGKPPAKETCKGYASRTSCKLPEGNSKKTPGLFYLDNLRLRKSSYVCHTPHVVLGLVDVQFGVLSGKSRGGPFGESQVAILTPLGVQTQHRARYRSRNWPAETR